MQAVSEWCRICLHGHDYMAPYWAQHPQFRTLATIPHAIDPSGR